MRTAVSLVAMTCLVASGSAMGQVGQDARRVRSTDRPIVELLRPTDQRIVLEWSQPPPSLMVPPFEQLLDAMADASDLVVVLRVEHKEARLTAGSRRDRNASGQEWIRSVVTARVERLIKPSPRLPVSTGSRVTFIEEGGTLQVGSTQVEAVVPWARPFQVGKRYLIFSRVPTAEARQSLEPEWQIGAGPASSYEEVFPGVIRRLQTRDSSDLDQIESMGLEAVVLLLQQRFESSEAR